jgi:hypothetical protein
VVQQRPHSNEATALANARMQCGIDCEVERVTEAAEGLGRSQQSQAANQNDCSRGAAAAPESPCAQLEAASSAALGAPGDQRPRERACLGSAAGIERDSLWGWVQRRRQYTSTSER